MRGAALLIPTLMVVCSARAQTSAPQQTVIKAGRLVDGRSANVQTNVGILISGERIQAVGPVAQITAQAPNARVIDLGQMTVLPGSRPDGSLTSSPWLAIPRGISRNSNPSSSL
jgi:hypothetical protein